MSTAIKMPFRMSSATTPSVVMIDTTNSQRSISAAVFPAMSKRPDGGDDEHGTECSLGQITERPGQKYISTAVIIPCRYERGNLGFCLRNNSSSPYGNRLR